MLNWSCPADIEPYERLYQLQERKADEHAWLQGQYFYEAVITAMDNAFAGKKSKLKYTDKPYSLKAREDKGQIAYDDKMRKVKGIFMQLQVMKTNFELSHPKGGEADENKQ